MSGCCRVFLWTVVVFAASSPPDMTAAVPEASRIVVSCHAPSAVVLNEPVVVELHLKNESAETIHYDLGFNRQAGLAVRVKSPDGAVHTPRIVASDVGRVGRMVLRPYEESAHELLLNDWLRFDQIGTYEVTIRLTEPIRTASGENVKTPPATQFQLRVGPHDPHALRQVCQRLADTVMLGETAEERLNAARALSHVADPAVLPFVREILAARRDVDWLLVQGLVRVRHAAAEAILLEMAQSMNEERAALGRNALERIAMTPK
jgi:hypothetical protein